MTFKFLHAADLHLDSPLLGLASKSADYASRVDRASRDAFENLVAVAIEEGCAFVLFAGDLFDGELRNFETGLFFIDQMRRLDAARIRAFIILGNHDAENRFASKLALTDNVHLFGARRAESVKIEPLSVTIHGRSFPQRDVTENIARDYPAAVPGHFNIGLLHTACQGSESYHAPYAPCSLEQLVNHGYDYWALGHVHNRAVLNEHPYVVYPGNLQGRTPRETGAKGASLVTVEDGQVTEIIHCELDVVRWVTVKLDITGSLTHMELVERLRDPIERARVEAGDRAIATRIHLTGVTDQHHRLLREPHALREDIATLLASVAGNIWLEKVKIATSAPQAPEATDPTVAGRLAAELDGPESREKLAALIEAGIAEVRAKMPAGAHADSFFETLRGEAPERARALALALISDREADDAAR
ncbi:MAG: exonuclease SbcCD subunit D [Hyphomicrobiaceae bacterium]